MEPKYFDDLEIGAVREHPGQRISAEEIIEFGRKFDPELFHVDPVAAEHSVFGGLVASGVHTVAVWRRMDWEAAQGKGWAVIAGAGFDEMRLRAPVHAGDTIRLHSELIEKIPSRSKPDRGVIRMRETVSNQHDEVVMTMVSMAMVRRRPQDRRA